MENLYSYSDICSNGIDSISISVDEQKYSVDLRQITYDAYRLRVIVSTSSSKQFQKDLQLFGQEVSYQSFGALNTNSKSEIILRNDTIDFLKTLTPAFDEVQQSYLQCRVFEDHPVNPNGIFDVILIPQPIVTLVLEIFSEGASNQSLTVQKYFDGFSYLGFALADIPRMNAIIKKNYADNDDIDLVYEFANSNLVDELFDEGSLIITWGINPFSYPVYSCQSVEEVATILGEPFEFSGKYKIQPDINSLSIIPGHKLKKWSTSDTEVFPAIDILGEGNLATLQPYSLRDELGKSIIPSFALYRSFVDNPVSEPLLNVNLLD